MDMASSLDRRTWGSVSILLLDSRGDLLRAPGQDKISAGLEGVAYQSSFTSSRGRGGTVRGEERKCREERETEKKRERRRL